MQYSEIVAGLPRFLGNGLSRGVKNGGGQVCVVAAIMAVENGLGPDGIVTDMADCVGFAVRRFAIRLNDAPWSSPVARAHGLRDLAVAMVGSKEVDQRAFVRLYVTRFIQTILADTLDTVAQRQKDPHKANMTASAVKCRDSKTLEECRASATAAAAAAYAADAAAADVAYAVNAANAAARKEMQERIIREAVRILDGGE